MRQNHSFEISTSGKAWYVTLRSVCECPLLFSIFRVCASNLLYNSIGLSYQIHSLDHLLRYNARISSSRVLSSL